MIKKLRIVLLAISCIVCFHGAFAQKNQNDLVSTLQGGANAVKTAVPFLMISPDARSGSLGDAGVASSPDAYSQHWNPAKYAFIENDMGVSLTYSPWMRSLANDMNLLFLSGYSRFNDRSTFAGSITYFSLGDVMFRSSAEDREVTYRPNEFAIDLSYSNRLSDHFSIAVAARYIRSDITQGQMVGTTRTKAGNSVAADIAAYYNKDIDVKGLKNSTLALGMNISNIGAKMSYSDNVDKDFIPTNLRIGGAYTIEVDDYNKFTLMLDLNKLMTPTSPITDSAGNVLAGKDPNVGILQGMIQSFYDAPNGFKEEMQEISFSIAGEYMYNNLVAFRGGFFHEHKNKGNRRYVTLGAGLKYNVLGLDFSYLIPVTALNNHPLRNTLRFSLTFDISAFQAQNKQK